MYREIYLDGELVSIKQNLPEGGERMFSPVESNMHYQEYLEWKAQGNEPEIEEYTSPED